MNQPSAGSQAMRWQEFLRSQETMPAIVQRMARTTPHRPFAHTVEGDSLNWEQLHASMEAWAARFLALGVQRGDVVATLVDAGLGSLAAWLGLASLGAIDAATNAEFRGRMLAYAINNCRPSLVVVSRHHLHALEAVAGDLQTVKQVLVVDDGNAPAPIESKLPGVVSVQEVPCDLAAARSQMRVPDWHEIACITYTSGTTGPSKAVMLPWAQLHSINLGTFPFEDLAATDVVYSVTSHAHFGAKSIPFLAAMVGGQVVIRSRFSLSNFWPDIERFGITTASLVGTMADVLLRSPDSPRGPTSLKNLFLAPLGPSYRQFAERFGVRICTVYNSTEGGVPICSGWNPTNERTAGRLRQGYPGFEVRLVDSHDFEVPDGTPGECIVRSAVPWVQNAGYFNNPEATAAAWRNGWFHTGDVLVRTKEGDYQFVDRLKDAIRRRGENISSFEVEADVLRNPDIVECAAVAVPAATTEDEILLFAVPRPGATIDPQTLAADLEKRVTRFMVPRYIELVESLPKTQATLRIIKAELRQRGVGPRTWDRESRAFVGATHTRDEERS
jgi:crotonobetaine/carnitine-CoA ligase